MDDDLIPARKAAKRLGRSVRQLRRMIHQNRIAALNDHGRFYLRESVIRAYLGNLPKAKGESP